MRFKTMTTVTMAGITACVLALAGCSVNPHSMTGDNRVSVEKQDSEKVKILWTDVYQEDGQTWAYGVLKSNRIHTRPRLKHMWIFRSCQKTALLAMRLFPMIYMFPGTDAEKVRTGSDLKYNLPGTSQRDRP